LKNITRKAFSFPFQDSFFTPISNQKMRSLFDFFTFSSFVNKSMLKKIPFLRKGLPAVCIYALEGTLSCVRSQMIKEIMPLPENHFT
jgi:hypothetical protein